MRRFIFGVLAAGFFALIGLEAFHHHQTAAQSDDCSICAVVSQAQAKHSPSAAPAVRSVSTLETFFSAPAAVLAARRASSPTGRSPPAA